MKNGTRGKPNPPQKGIRLKGSIAHVEDGKGSSQVQGVLDHQGFFAHAHLKGQLHKAGRVVSGPSGGKIFNLKEKGREKQGSRKGRHEDEGRKGRFTRRNFLQAWWGKTK